MSEPSRRILNAVDELAKALELDLSGYAPVPPTMRTIEDHLNRLAAYAEHAVAKLEEKR